MSYVFLDRDGTLIRHIPYLSDAGQVELLPGVAAGLGKLRDAGCTLILHSNQSGIGRGYFSLADVVACNDRMIDQIGLGAEVFADVCICPEVPGAQTLYRKPSPKYAQEIMARYAVSPANLCYVGDNITDLLTAKNIGCAGVGVSTGVHDLRPLLREHGLEHFPVFDSFLEAAEHVVKQFGRTHARH